MKRSCWLLALLLLVAACSGGESAIETSPAPSTTTSTPTPSDVVGTSDDELTLSFNETTDGRVFFPHNWRRQTE
ncbi:MAG: hypothetical protein QNL12_15840 [Acidimicrobiia bacterium]|nr:hypothetical protein [Acidimicrobiia bacterium]MDX2468784.1 hypothetical protein [Acidimicrobiia bacterium]